MSKTRKIKVEAIAEEKTTAIEMMKAEIAVVNEKLKDFTNARLIIMEKEYKLREWITLRDYSVKYNIKPSRLSNWLERGVVPADSLIVIPELNGLKLIKDKSYEIRERNAPAAL